MGHSADLEKDKISGQTNMFDLLDMGAPTKTSSGLIDTTAPTMPLSTKLFHEKELLGFYVSGHPMNEYARFDFALDDIPNPASVQRIKKAQFRACGVVSNVTKKLSKKENRPWFYFTLSGRLNSKVWQINVFPDAYEEILKDMKMQHGEDFDVTSFEGKCFCVIGECRSDDGAELRLTGQKIIPMNDAIAGNVESIEWLISPYAQPEHFVKHLSQCIYNYAPGNSIRHVLKIQVSENSFI